ncbi:hypothetical protein DSM106972_025870 [Dulcicalothrix desertica PCC 7102]|uniref:Uncharacterized protein n=1 Tax=Dulcicalothrix desertica PCC 7102 TaxID=232991 RepID=A0A3S1DCD9_9CYAN|nr:hypothetical protein DSM106972_025870 [Dulcicalothrix desertica PCC 7102]
MAVHAAKGIIANPAVKNTILGLTFKWCKIKQIGTNTSIRNRKASLRDMEAGLADFFLVDSLFNFVVDIALP